MPELPIVPSVNELPLKNSSAGKRRTLAESVTVRSMPVRLARATQKEPPTLALCLQVAPFRKMSPRLLSCSFAANFGLRDRPDEGQEDAPEGGLPSGATVAMIRPMAKPGIPTVWRPALGQLVGLALREMSLSPAQLREQPIVLALHAVLPTVNGFGGLLRQSLPACGIPRWLRLRITDFQGRVYAVSVWAADISPIPGEIDNLDTLAGIVGPMLKRCDDVEDATIPNDPEELPAFKETQACEAAAQQARLALYFTCQVLKLEIGGDLVR